MMAAAHMGSRSDDDLWHCVNAQTLTTAESNTHTHTKKDCASARPSGCFKCSGYKAEEKITDKGATGAEWRVIKEEVGRERKDNGISVSAKTRQKRERGGQRLGK